MNNIERLIYPDNKTELLTYSNEQWVSIVSYLLEQFQEFLGTPVEHEQPLAPNVGRGGYCVDIWGPTPLLGPLRVTWKGIFGGVVLEDPTYLHMCVSVFLYSNSKKIITREGHDFLEFIYVKDINGKPNWKLDCWLPDEYEEYECYDKDDPLGLSVIG